MKRVSLAQETLANAMDTQQVHRSSLRKPARLRVGGMRLVRPHSLVGVRHHTAFSGVGQSRCRLDPLAFEDVSRDYLRADVTSGSDVVGW